MATSEIVALQAASLVVVSVRFSMHEAVVVVHVFGFRRASCVKTLLLITRPCDEPCDYAYGNHFC